jgi:hypothetical protein
MPCPWHIATPDEGDRWWLADRASLSLVVALCAAVSIRARRSSALPVVLTDQLADEGCARPGATLRLLLTPHGVHEALAHGSGDGSRNLGGAGQHLQPAIVV